MSYSIIMIRFLFCICITLISFNTEAQRRPFNTGLTFDDASYREVPHLPKFSGNKYDNVPYRVSLRKYAPIPGDQGLDGTCTAWAAAYGGLSICRAIKDSIINRPLITQQANSVYYVFNQVRLGEDCSLGARLPDALRLMKEQGVCLAATFKDELQDCQKEPTSTENEEATKYKIKDFAAAFAIEDTPALKIDKTRKLLASNNPVVVGMNLTSSFWLMEPGDVVWDPSEEEQSGKFGHALLVVGYDDIKKSFEIMNSWGPEWGDQGFFWVKYEDFGRFCKYGFQIILDDKVKRLKESATEKEELIVEMTGDFIFRYPTGYILDKNGNETIAFQEATVKYDSTQQLYRTNKEVWKVGDIFQLVATNIPAGKTAYIFSIDPSHKVTIHWPMVDESIDALNKVPLANFMSSKNAAIIIPGEEEALQLGQAGKDDLIILFSDQVILDFEKRVLQMSSLKGSTSENLTATFGDLLVESSLVDYQSDKMAFKSTFDVQEGFVVPIILSVIAK